MKLGQPLDIHLAARYYQFNRAFAIRDVFDALVELMTNSGDSPAKVLIKNMNQQTMSAEKLRYIQPAGNLVCDEIFDVPGYDGVKAALKIW